MTTVGTEHARLSYHYLDLGDAEGYMSLLDPETRFHHPGERVARGPAEAFRSMKRLGCTGGRHSLFKTVSEGDTVIVVGRFTSDDVRGNQKTAEFADVFTLTDLGLLLTRRRYSWQG
ncbi:nuclear transport factor 2 family protein [Nocardiopsis lambiniae]|uniref:nuclear transport factor 2 family protein n=1 Tax=Nocardiopsis lambiniae TaxID=3075539 RepID=UPI00288A6AAD|nr:nuclear transport factor 2 family protein [Nocardiopsis sp. DSM 44743]